MNSAKWIPRHKLLFWYTKERNWKIVQCFLVWPHKCTPSPPLPPLSLPPPSLPPPSLSPHVGSMQATWFQWGQPTVNAGRVWCGDRAYMDGWCHVYRKWTESRSLPVQWLGKPQLCPPWRCWCRLWRYIYGPQATTLCTHCEKIYILVITLFSSIPCHTVFNCNNVNNVPNNVLNNLSNNVPNNLPTNVPNNFSKGKKMRDNDRN